MCKKVKKRDGTIVQFDYYKIVKAIQKAFEATQVPQDIAFASRVASRIEEHSEELDVESIQDMVVCSLIETYPKVAEAYQKYRDQRTIARESKIISELDSIASAEANDITKENANMNADTPSGMMYKAASQRSKDYALKRLISPKFALLHREGYIHIHDLDYYWTGSLTCLQHPLDRILSKGFKAGHGESRPAHRIETAAMLACISLEAIQNEMHGGQGIPAFDFYLAPYVRMSYIEEIKKIETYTAKDYKFLYDAHIKEYLVEDLPEEEVSRVKQQAINNTVKRVHQAMESFIHNMNTIHSRGGNQVVFSSINYGTDTSAEGRCIIREVLNSTIEGIGNGRTAIFPIQIWKSKTGVSYLPSDPNYDLYLLAQKSTAARFFPNYINLDFSEYYSPHWNSEDPNRYLWEAATMGCRTSVFSNVNGLEGSVGRGNLSFTTINLPRIGILLSKKDIQTTEEKIEALKEEVLKYTDIVAEQLHERYEYQCKFHKKNFPLLMSKMWNGSEVLKDDDSIKPVLSQGTLSVGFIGLAEMLIALFGKHHGESDEMQSIGLSIVKLIHDRCTYWTKKTHLNYSCFATPAEGLSGRFVKIDRAKFGVIKGVTDKDYYTNSNHVPVYYKCTASHKGEIECAYHKYTTAGGIFYIEQDGDPTNNPESISRYVDIMHRNNGMYMSINFNQNICLDCGYTWNGKEHECPKCHSTNLDALARITGYLTTSVKNWNLAKQGEFWDRVAHS